MNIQFDNLNFKITKNNSSTDWASLMNDEDRSFQFEVEHNSVNYKGVGVRGDDALWFPLNTEKGIKIVAENERYQSLQESLETVEYIQENKCVSFPVIYDACIMKTDKQKDYLVIEMENMNDPKRAVDVPRYVPSQDAEYIKNNIQVDPKIANKIVREITSLKLCPEDEWYKSINLINGKIVDFHRFKIMKSRYYMPSNNKSVHELFDIYRNMVKRYLDVRDHNGAPKWKGKIYQGFAFDNGYLMEGYQSGNEMYDSYHKLPFIPINKSKGKKVLDLGSNQGFFSFQAAIHGASSVVGVEMTKQDVQAANDIKEITKFDNIEFINGDAIKFVLESDELFSLVVFNSVLHQIYPNFIGAEEFMTKLSSMTDYLAFETPLNHPLMNISAASVENELKKYFSIVRLIYIYDAYSSGYRANYVCYS